MKILILDLNKIIVKFKYNDFVRSMRCLKSV